MARIRKARGVQRTKVALLTCNQDSAWGSCNSILAGLRSAYGSLAREYDFVPTTVCPRGSRFDSHHGGGYFLRLARALRESGVRKLLFVDHNVPVEGIVFAIRALDPAWAQELEFTFHLYGDFTLHLANWHRVGNALEGHRARFLCASPRQRELVRFFTANPGDGAVEYCPFPVDAEAFAFRAPARRAWRRKLGLGDEHLALYSGRVSLQKGILRMLQEFAILDSEAVLAIAGSYDDVGGPSLNLRLRPGYFYQSVNELLATLPTSVRKRIRFLGPLARPVLSELYSAADSFVSLSLYHDEDFGMSPAEALASGLPSLLTDWGGYPSLAGLGTSLLPVQLEERGLALDARTLRAQWLALLEKRLSPEERRAAGANFAARFSVSRVAEHLGGILARSPHRFAGFHWRTAVPFSSAHLKHGLYGEVYGHYVAGTKEATI